VKRFLAFAALALLTIGCDSGGGSPTDPSQVNIEYTTTDLVVGTGAQAAVGNTATVNYTLWLYNSAGVESKGTRLQSSLDPGNTPLQLVVGARQFIPGFEQAVLGMRIGGKRRAYIPASLAYGSQGSQQGGIPPNAAVVFEIELVNLVQ
jgi:FKBP-type peptidyl-prolyl cis-trans isomerase FkpA